MFQINSQEKLSYSLVAEVSREILYGNFNYLNEKVLKEKVKVIVLDNLITSVNRRRNTFLQKYRIYKP